MPILHAEPALYPPELFTASFSATRERTWHVVHTKPRQEKGLARQLHQGRIPYYLPLIRRRQLLRGRTLVSHLPLFPSYVFLHATAEERLAALATQRIVRTLPVANQERLWHDVSQIHQLIESGMPITPEDQLTPGTTVLIRSGALAGLRGTIIRAAAGQRFVVQVDFIQRGASVEVDDVTLQAVIE